MSEKKRYDWDLNGIWDFKNNKSDDYVAEYDGICDILNAKEERISELEKQNKELIQIIKGISKDSADAISKLWRKGMYD